jgi:hypothetical protein
MTYTPVEPVNSLKIAAEIEGMKRMERELLEAQLDMLKFSVRIGFGPEQDIRVKNVGVPA